MKKLFTILTLMTLTVVVFAQAPQTFSYQTVIRDNNWQAVSNQDVSIEIAIIEDVASGTVVYKEVHDPTTNELGLVNLAIGSGGIMQGNWTNIDWGNHTYFIEVAVDVTGGTSYIVMGTTQLRSVPYALYAENSGSSTPGPQGLQGIQGLPGDTGAIGPQGPIGLTGAQGIQGIQGLPGDTGATGPQGIQGPAGNDGADGTNGTDGTNGVDGAVGAQGPIGLTGAQGIQGIQGLPGDTGAVGAQGPIGLTGAQGIQGPAGNDGADGVDGIDGVDGAVGAQGPIGLTGAQGIQGPAGNDGADGQDGIDGVDGIDGIDAVVDYDSLANLISVDSTFINNVGGGIGGGSCDYSFPEGLEGDMIAWDLSNGNDYTVPAGKNLFITNVHTNDGSSFRIDGIRVLDGLWGVYIANFQGTAMLKQPLCVKSGQVVSASTNSSYTETFYGFLTDAVVEPISFWFDNVGSGNDSYTVPVGKKLVITNVWMYGSSNSDLTIDGIIIAAENFNKPEAYSNKYLEIPLIIESGSIISIPNNYSSFNGYLADENYFAGCGGGGSSSTSSLDSTAIANMIAGAGGGCNLKSPEGINGVAVTEKISQYNDSYTVPVGKRLYVLSLDNTFAVINGKDINTNVAQTNPLILNSGDVLTASTNPGSHFNGYLVDESASLTAVTEKISQYNDSYTVPVGKRLYVLVLDNTLAVINGKDIYKNVSGSSNPLILNSGDVLTASTNPGSHFNGYLVDENYFTGCSGGSSSSSSNNTSSSPIFITPTVVYSEFYSNINPVVCVGSGSNPPCADNISIFNVNLSSLIPVNTSTVILETYFKVDALPGNTNPFGVELNLSDTLGDINVYRYQAPNSTMRFREEKKTIHLPVDLSGNLTFTNNTMICENWPSFYYTLEIKLIGYY